MVDIKIGTAKLEAHPLVLSPEFHYYFRRNLRLLGYRMRLVHTMDCSSWPNDSGLPARIRVESYTGLRVPIPGTGRIDTQTTKNRLAALYKRSGLFEPSQIDRDVQASTLGGHNMAVPTKKLEQLYNEFYSVVVGVWLNFRPYLVYGRSGSSGARSPLFTISQPVSGTFIAIPGKVCNSEVKPPSRRLAEVESVYSEHERFNTVLHNLGVLRRWSGGFGPGFAHDWQNRRLKILDQAAKPPVFIRWNNPK
ncbi:hypothetical protein [Oceanicola sp. 502str15]|uniref:hypothetical protein n=1 Tax=Oceanicola sp. 502str15 TaxID=2696061 RepID=UPI002095B85E|nr:hypothetical protein [Oceanicola sp. 502str15]MCO6384291.1 hypothetical protein [Oceanicola sp. 502str15]